MKLFAGLLVAVGIAAGAAQAETVVSLSQVNYDAAGQVKCTAVRMDPAQYTSTTLEPDACTLDAVDAYGPDRITKNLYTVRGELKEVRRAVGTGIEQPYARYTYSDNGVKTSEKDANGNLTTLEYDGYDRVKKLRYPSTAIGAGTSSTTDYEQFTYDNNGNKLTWRRRNGTTITYCYDNLSRVTRENVSGVSCATAGQSVDVFTGYDLRGNILWKRFASATGSGVSYGYDSLGRVNTTTDMNGRAIWYAYNAASARTATAYPDGFTFYRSLDALNRLNHVSNGSTVYFSQAYFSTGERKKLLRGGAIASGERTDAACVAQTNATCYSYDALGRLTSMNIDLNNTANDIIWTFNGRNPDGQITSWNATSTVYDYEEISSSTVNKSYDGLNRDAGIAAITGGYDSNGNLAKEGGSNRCMVYDNLNRLISVANCTTPSIPFLTLTYDPLGRLASYIYNLATTEFLYDGKKMIGEYSHSGTNHSGDTLQNRYVHGTGTEEPLVWFAGASTSSANYFVNNYQGSIIGYSNSSGALVEIYKYGPYGEPKNNSGAEYWGGAHFRYTGQYALADAKLYYYRARVYDPAYGRFLQTDPIGSADDLNLYAYVGGDPVNFIDPTGLRAYLCGWIEEEGEAESEAGSSKDSEGEPVVVVVKGKKRPPKMYRAQTCDDGLTDTTKWEPLPQQTKATACAITQAFKNSYLNEAGDYRPPYYGKTRWDDYSTVEHDRKEAWRDIRQAKYGSLLGAIGKEIPNKMAGSGGELVEAVSDGDIEIKRMDYMLASVRLAEMDACNEKED